MNYTEAEGLLINGGKIRKKDWEEGKFIGFYEQDRKDSKDGTAVIGVFYITPNGKSYRSLKNLLSSEGIKNLDDFEAV